MNEKEEAQSGARSLQREASRTEAIQEQRKKVQAVRQGHATGGYCESESLKAEEKILAKILSEAIEHAKKIGDDVTVRSYTREINGLSWKPRLVVAE